MYKSLKSNVVFNFIKTLSSILFPIVTFPYISRVLLPANVGKVNFAVAFVSYFSLIASLGITTYAIRECAAVRGNKVDLDHMASQIFSINAITTCFAYLALFLTLFLFRDLDNYRALIIIQSTAILFTTLGADWLNSAMEDFRYITLRTVCVQIFSIVAMLLFVREVDDYYNYAIIGVLAGSGANIANIWYRKRYCNITFTTNIEWEKHMVPIFYLFAMMLSQVIFNHADVTMLGIMCSDFEVGIYSTAFKATTLISTLVSSVFLVLMPRLSYYFAAQDYENVNRLLEKLFSINIGLGLPCFIGVVMLAKDIVFVIGGKEFAAAAPVLQILMFAFLFSLIGGNFLGNAVLIPSKREKYYMIVCCITAVCNIILNYLLIPLYATNGAAIATAFNGCIIMVLLLLKVDKNIVIPVKSRIIIPPLVGCLLIMLTCYTCTYIDIFIIRFLLSVVLSGVLYSATLIAFKYDIIFSVLKPILQKKFNIKG